MACAKGDISLLCCQQIPAAHYFTLFRVMPATLTSLEVSASVYGTPLSYPPGAILPARGERRRYNDITHGRDGGSRQA